MRVENVADPQIQQPTDAIVKITHACICGSDLWFYRGLDNWEPGWRTGHVASLQFAPDRIRSFAH